MINWFKTGTDIQVLTDSKIIQKQYKKYQWSNIISLIIGYSFFYTCRLSLSIAKKPMLDEGYLTLEQIGLMGSALLFTYAIGKFVNGFLSDYANISRFISLGLLISALINIILGFNNSALIFIVFWGINGWFQSMGSAPSCVSIFQWFSPKRRGSVYSIWAGSHNIGEGLTFVITSLVVGAWGWRYGFIVPGALSLVVALLMFNFLKDRPQTMGLPNPAVAFNEAKEADILESKGTLKSQLYAIKSPVVWIIALSCAMMYVSRYAVNSWAILYLQEAKGYSLEHAGFAMSTYPIFGLIGAVLSGFISDKMFQSDRIIPSLIYGACNVGGMLLLFYGPNDNYIIDAIALGIFGFGIGGLIVFLGGLMAADLMPKKAVGTVKGFIGLFSYLASSAQEYISGVLIKSSEISGVKVYDFRKAIIFWIGAGVLSIIFIANIHWIKKVTIKNITP